MAEEGKDQGVQPTEIDYKAELEKIKQQNQELAEAQKKALEDFENLKKDRDGQSRKNSELSKQLQEMQEKGMSQEELFQKQQQEWEAEKKKQEREIARQAKETAKKSAILELGLDPKMEQYLSGETKEDFIESGKNLTNIMQELISAGIKKELGKVDANPIGSGEGLSKADVFDQAIKSGDIAAALQNAIP